MRRMLLTVCVPLACTRPNPGFGTHEHDSAASTETTGASSSTNGGTAPHPDDDDSTTRPGDESDGETTSETTSETTGLPTCDLEPSKGATLAFWNPTHTSNICPTSMSVWGHVVEVEGMAAFQLCNLAGCEQCDTALHPLAVLPLSVADHVPIGADRCVRIEATDATAQEPETCYWGALTIYDGSAPVPYIVATTKSHAPTPVGQELIDNVLPEPAKGLSCNCDSIGHGNDCCYQASTPEFWFYAWEGMSVFPGDRVPIAVSNDDGVEHTFALFQAQRIPTCDQHELELSWAIVAKL